MFRKKNKLPIHWSKIEASAPGKFVLIGDFGDLYERNVIAVAIDKRLKVTIRPHKDEAKLRLRLKDFNETREWPTRLPLFSMTKLVANYADPLEYSETAHQTLRPLLNRKYVVEMASSEQQQQSSQQQGEPQARGTNGLDGDDKRHEVVDKSTGLPGAETTQQPAATATTNSSANCQSTWPPEAVRISNLFEESQTEGHANKDLGCSLMDRTASDSERADMAVLACLLLYISLGDSFAASYRPALDIEVESEIPMCRGLGSSSAYAVAMCTGLMKVFRVSAEPTVILDWTQSIDRLFHGEKSSLHSSVAIHGGYIYLQHGKMKYCGVPHQSPLKLMLIDTGLRRDPKLVNRALLEKLDQKHDSVITILNTVNEHASQTWRRMNDPDFMPSTIDDSLLLAQKSLDLVGLGHRMSFVVFFLARQSHLLVKQSQAGETVFLLYDGFEDFDNVNAFRENLKRAGFSWLDQSISFEGFKVSATKLTDEEPFPKLPCH